MMNVLKFQFSLYLFFLITNLSCSKPVVGAFLQLSSEVEDISTTRTERIVIASGTAAHLGISLWDDEGGFLSVLADYKTAGNLLRGLAFFDNDSFLVSMDTNDQIDKIALDGTESSFYNGAQLSGNIYGITKDSSGNFYVVEGNVIEKFDSSGTRVGNPFIATTIGACVLNTPRGLTINSQGQLAVVNQGGTDNLNIYNISSGTATCSTAVAIGNNPYGIVSHPNGNLYIAAQTNSVIYSTTASGASLTTVWAADLTVISTPTGIAVLGEHLLVASTLTNSVERISTSGARVDSSSFMTNLYTNNIQDVLVMPEVR